jgi:hypothetical protein
VTTRAEHLDDLLTGLAFADAYANHDTAAVEALLADTDPRRAIEAILNTGQLLTSILAARLGADVAEVRQSVRRRVIVELAREGTGR